VGGLFLEFGNVKVPVDLQHAERVASSNSVGSGYGDVRAARLMLLDHVADVHL
jgi:hypothetical protein